MQPCPDQHLLYGAPAPEFLLPPLDGVPATFYERYCGRPAVVVLAAHVAQLCPRSQRYPATWASWVLCPDKVVRTWRRTSRHWEMMGVWLVLAKYQAKSMDGSSLFVDRRR